MLFKKKFYHILLLVVPLIIFLFFYHKSLNEKITNKFLFNGNIEKADSTIATLNLERKIKLLFLISDFNLENINDFSEFSGYIFNSSSFNEYEQYISSINKFRNYSVFNILESNNNYPNNFDEFPKISNHLMFEAIDDDSLLLNFLNYSSELNRLLKYNFFISNTLSIDDTIDFNSNYFEKKINYIKNISSAYNINNKFSCINISNNQLIIDSNHVQHFSDILSGLFTYGLNSIMYNQKVKFNNKISLSEYLHNIEKYNYNIIDLRNKKINKAKILDFLKNSGDLFVLKNESIEELKSIINELIVQNKISEQLIDSKLQRVLLAREWAGKTDIKFSKDIVLKYLNSVKSKKIIAQINSQSAIILDNSKNIIPIVGNKKIELIKHADSKTDILINGLSFYANFNVFKFKSANDFREQCAKKDSITRIVFIDFNILNINDKNQFYNFLNNITNENNIIFAIIDSVQNLRKISKRNTIIFSIENNDNFQETLSKVIYGGIKLNTNLPSYSNRSNDVKNTKIFETRISISEPELVNVNSLKLLKIDSIVNDAINKFVFPGCQVFVIKNNKVIYNKSFGYQTYEKKIKINEYSLFDIASVTKIAATTISAMKMYNDGRIKLNDKIGNSFKNTKIDYTRVKPDTIIKIDTINTFIQKNYIKKIKNQDTIRINDSLLVLIDTLIYKVTPKLNVFQCNFENLLLHKSGLPPSVPILRFLNFVRPVDDKYYKNIIYNLPDSIANNEISIEIKKDSLKNSKRKFKNYYNDYYSKSFKKDSANIQIANNLFLRKKYFDTLWIDTKQIKVYNNDVFEYSDANFLMIQQAIDSLNGYSINNYLDTNIFKPLNLNNILYNPLSKFEIENIVPTEEDKYWRKQLVHGFVHDETAALFGGVAGNAGLFSNAKDLGILFQMILNRGEYGGIKILEDSVVNKFISKQENSHRALGFDMPSENAIISKYASKNSFGHTGFTGCVVWVDPYEELVFIFLSNRVHPKKKNFLINTYKIRQKVHDAIYEAIEY